jgi:hypothetical protein
VSFINDLLSAGRQIALVQDKVDRALATADAAMKYSIENRERIAAIEGTLNYAIMRSGGQKRLPPS